MVGSRFIGVARWARPDEVSRASSGGRGDSQKKRGDGAALEEVWLANRSTAPTLDRQLRARETHHGLKVLELVRVHIFCFFHREFGALHGLFGGFFVDFFLADSVFREDRDFIT